MRPFVLPVVGVLAGRRVQYELVDVSDKHDVLIVSGRLHTWSQLGLLLNYLPIERILRSLLGQELA